MEERRDYNGLRAIIREEARAAMNEWASSAEAREMVSRGIRAYHDEQVNVPCFQRCDRIDSADKRIVGIQRILYGDDGTDGLVGDVRDLRAVARLLMWLTSVVGAAALAALVESLIRLIR